MVTGIIEILKLPGMNFLYINLQVKHALFCKVAILEIFFFLDRDGLYRPLNGKSVLPCCACMVRPSGIVVVDIDAIRKV